MKEDRKYHSLAIALLSLLAIALYFNSLNNSFHFDDFPNIVENPYIRNLKDFPLFLKGVNSYTGEFRALSSLSFAINYHFHKLNVFGYHLVNLILHILSGVLVYFISMDLFVLGLKKNVVFSDNPVSTEGRTIHLFSFVSASFFISHPIQVNTVTYIVQRGEGLAGFFYLLCFFLFIKGSVRNGRVKYLFFSGAGLSLIGSLFSKETGFTLPIVLFLFDFLFICQKREEIFTRLKIYIPLLIFLGIYLFFFLKGGVILNMLMAESKSDWTPWENLLTQSNVIIQYFKLLFLPLPRWLNIDHDFQLSKSLWEYPTLLSVSIILLLLISAIFLVRKHRLISFAIFFFFITLAPSSSIIPLWDIMVEYRLYLPIFSYSLILTLGFHTLYQFIARRYSKKIGQGVVGGILVCVLSLYSVTTIERNAIFKDGLTLWNDAVKKSPNKMRTHHNMGKAYFEKGQMDQAIREGAMALRLSAHLIRKENVKFVLNLLGGAHGMKGEYDIALRLFQQAIQVDPNFATSHYNAGCIYATKKEKEKAFQYLRKAISLDPKYKEKAKVDEDFIPLRGEKEFEEMVK